jgi:branched-chain amino acid transport system ATP-binding protein
VSDPILELDDVHVAYLRKEILRGASLTVSRGEIVAVLGENGAGKSTALKVVAGLLHPSQGSVRYQGRDLRGVDTAHRQRLGIGYLMQGGRVFPNLTVQENHDLALAGARMAAGLVPRLGDWFPTLRDRRSARAGLLSGGQRQMLAIEMVLAPRPSLLLLDEPTAALAEDAAAVVLKTFEQYVTRQSAAALLVEQNVRAALTLVHRHVILADASFRKDTANNAAD